MACTVNSSALTSIDNLLRHMGRSPDSVRVNALRLYVVGTGGSSAATVQVDHFNSRVQIVVTGGDDAGTANFPITASTTVGGLKTTIEAFLDSEITLLTHSSQLTIDLVEVAATNCLGLANAVTLQARDTCRLAHAINRASELVERVTGRRFAAATYTEEQRTSGAGTLVLKQWPITSVVRVSVGRREALQISNSSTDAVYKLVRIDRTNNTLYLNVVGGTNDGTVSIDLDETATLDALVTAIALNGSGWSGTVASGANLGNLPTTWLLDQGATIAADSSYASIYAADTPIYGYATDDIDAGVLKLGKCYADTWTVVQYTAGFATVPDDVVGVVNDVAQSMFNRATINRDLKREKLGDYEYELSEADTAELSANIADELAHYMVPVG